MKEKIFAGSIVLCAFIIVVSFFMPWATATVSATKVAKSLADSAGGKVRNIPFTDKIVQGFGSVTDAIGNLGDINVKTTVSGYNIPVMVNDRSSRVAIQLAEIFFKDAKDLDKKSMLVWLMPLLAAVCGALAVIGLRYKVAVIAAALTGCIMGIGGLYELITTDLSALPVHISIKIGLWQTMYGYILIGILSIAWLVIVGKEKTNK